MHIVLLRALFFLVSCKSLAGLDGLSARFEISKGDKVRFRGVSLFHAQGEIDKYQIGHSPRDKGDRIYLLELLDSDGKLIDSAELKLSSAPRRFADAPNLPGDAETDIEVSFPLPKVIGKVRVSKQGKTLFEKSISELLAKTLSDLFKRSGTQGLKALEAAVAAHPYVEGKEREFLQVVKDATGSCSASEMMRACETFHWDSEYGLR